MVSNNVNKLILDLWLKKVDDSDIYMWIKENVSIKKNGKTYTSTLVVKSVREGKTVKHKTLLNISSWSKEKITSFKSVLKGDILTSIEQLQLTAGKTVGGLFVLKKLAEEIGIIESIGKRNKRLSLILLLIIGRILTQGSRLHLLTWGKTQELQKVLGIELETITEEDLYKTLDYLAENQEKIEKKLFTLRCKRKGTAPRIYLYDVTSSYLEGEQNELAAYGYNRDKKYGKKQIVIGLLTDDKGNPIAVRAFTGNTQDPQTVQNQIQKLGKEYGVTNVIFVGDKGMIKTSQMQALGKENYHYITSITKPQIQTLMKQGILQLGLFDDTIGEVIDEKNNVRYIYRRNPMRAKEIQTNREQRQKKLQEIITKTNTYLGEHPKAKTETAHTNLQKAQERVNCDYLTITQTNRSFSLTVDHEKLVQAQELDGCFVIKTDCLKRDLTKQTIHDRYKDLKYVEAAFKTIKTGFLEIRPIYLRKETRTRGHIFVTMLAYLIIHTFQNKTQAIQATLTEKVDALDTIQTVSVNFLGETTQRIPQQPPFIQDILQTLHYVLPVTL